MISGLEFANRCKWVQDPRYPKRLEFYYQLARDGEWVFINGDYLDVFVKKLPAIRMKKFFIVVHNTDRCFGKDELEQVLPVAHHIFAINTTIRHSRLTTIPIGFRDCTLDRLRSFQLPSYERTIPIYGNFKICNNTIKRNECYEVFKDDIRVTWRPEVDFETYLDDLCRSVYVLCPEGTGMDTHRVYEALLCGATPVVLRNSLSGLYETLPVCIVDRWTDAFYKPTNHADFDIESFMRLK